MLSGFYRTIGGLLIATSSSMNSSRIVVEMEDKSINSFFKVINIYRPYSDHFLFCEGLSSSGILAAKNVILGGYLNFTLSSHEVWGDHVCIDAHEGFFSHLVIVNSLVDVEA